MPSTRFLSVATLGLAAIAAAAVPGNAGTLVPTEVKIRAGGTLEAPPLSGRLVSKRAECLDGRRVAIRALAPERGLIDFADNRTNAKGKWVFSSQLQGATAVRAEVKKRKVGGTTCKADVSPVKGF